MSPPFQSRATEFKQRLFFPTHIFDLLPDDHECYLYADLFQQLDTSKMEERYSPIGQHAYHAKLIVSILICAHSQGVFTSTPAKFQMTLFNQRRMPPPSGVNMQRFTLTPAALRKVDKAAKRLGVNRSKVFMALIGEHL